jgi:hypothetical protein
MSCFDGIQIILAHAKSTGKCPKHRRYVSSSTFVMVSRGLVSAPTGRHQLLIEVQVTFEMSWSTGETTRQ